ncbi:MAG TPA: ABC transporter ATP-binding protein [Planctomycetes bacterium]|nr:ABC transporter ATP-binding protein [Planctomycetota bacterium]
MSVELREISKRFGEVQALAAVSLSVAAGELFTLLGPSGCGKTTLLRTVAGFHRQDAGVVSIGGREVDEVPPHRRDVGLVFQSYALFPHLSVAENVAFGLEERRVARAEIGPRVERALAAVRLEDLGERRPDQLSGGQRQRVGIARALVIEPAVLLMDEPLSNLDAKLRVETRSEIRALQQAAGRTTLYVTHDQEEALAISDRLAVFEAGRVQQVGAPNEVYRRPANAFVAGFVGRMNFLPAARAPELAGAAHQLGLRPEDLSLHPADGQLSAPKLAARVRARVFLGPVLQVRLDCGEGLELEVEVHRPEPSAWREGEEVQVELAPERAHRFAADGSRVEPPE